MSREIDLIWYEPDEEIKIRIFGYEEFTKADKEFLDDLTKWLKGEEKCQDTKYKNM